jgi:hypothetical protein
MIDLREKQKENAFDSARVSAKSVANESTANKMQITGVSR